MINRDTYIDTFKLYMEEINQYPLLSIEEEEELAYKILAVKNCKLIKFEENNHLNCKAISNLFNEFNYNEKLENNLLFLINSVNIEKEKKELQKIYNEYCSKNKSIIEKNNTAIDNLCIEIKIYKDYLIAKEKMINSNLKLVVYIAQKYTIYGYDLYELICEGNSGLIRAVEKFDITMKRKFSTYATIWIKQKILRYMDINRTSLSITFKFNENIKIFKSKVAELENSTKKKYSALELSQILNMDYWEVVCFLNYGYVKSLDEPIYNESNLSLGETIVDRNTEEVFENIHEDLTEYFENLTDLEKNVIVYKFDLGKVVKITEEELESVKKLSDYKIAKIKNKALRMMRYNAKLLNEKYR